MDIGQMSYGPGHFSSLSCQKKTQDDYQLSRRLAAPRKYRHFLLSPAGRPAFDKKGLASAFIEASRERLAQKINGIV
jgi:hypothetical protein